jgi:hypothetical protein
MARYIEFCIKDTSPSEGYPDYANTKPNLLWVDTTELKLKQRQGSEWVTVLDLNLEVLKYYCPAWGELIAFNPGTVRPVTVRRSYGGQLLDVDCFVSQELVDAYTAGNLHIGDYVLILFLDHQEDHAIAFSKVYKTW